MNESFFLNAFLLQLQPRGLRMKGLGFKVWGLRLRLKIEGSRFRGLGIRVYKLRT